MERHERPPRPGAARNRNGSGASLAIVAACVLLLGIAGCQREGSATNQAGQQEGPTGEAQSVDLAEARIDSAELHSGHALQLPAKPEFSLTSRALEEGKLIPSQFTCDGEDRSPPLTWHNAPGSTRAFALIMDDPDAPGDTWDHWILFDIPPTTNSLPVGAGAQDHPGGGVAGSNSWHKMSYGGPCPPPGKTHRYFFKLYALSEPTGLEAGASKAELLEAMKERVLAEVELMGLYER
jgi:Raf kinase inhibitor-like YbhB/YbcL family protein